MSEVRIPDLKPLYAAALELAPRRATKARGRARYDTMQTLLSINAGLLKLLISQTDGCPLRRGMSKCWRDCEVCVNSYLLANKDTKDEGVHNNENDT